VSDKLDTELQIQEMWQYRNRQTEIRSFNSMDIKISIKMLR